MAFACCERCTERTARKDPGYGAAASQQVIQIRSGRRCPPLPVGGACRTSRLAQLGVQRVVVRWAREGAGKMAVKAFAAYLHRELPVRLMGSRRVTKPCGVGPGLCFGLSLPWTFSQKRSPNASRAFARGLSST